MMYTLNNQSVSEKAYQTPIDPMEAILSETDRLAANDARRFSADEVHRRLKESMAQFYRVFGADNMI